MNLTPRLTAARRQVATLRVDLATARLQRNVYRDHMRRMAGALSAVNEAVARSPHTDSNAVQEAVSAAVGLAVMALDYDDTQTAADPTIQEN